MTDTDESVEQRLWNRLHEQQERRPGEWVRIAHIAEHELPIGMERAAQLGRSWRNRGLVETEFNGRWAMLTDDGWTVSEVTDHD